VPRPAAQARREIDLDHGREPAVLAAGIAGLVIAALRAQHSCMEPDFFRAQARLHEGADGILLLSAPRLVRRARRDWRACFREHVVGQGVGPGHRHPSCSMGEWGRREEQGRNAATKFWYPQYLYDTDDKL